MPAHRRARGARATLLAAVLVLVVGLPLLGLGAWWVVSRFATAALAPDVPVHVEARVTREGDGLRVTATLTPVSGALPERIRVAEARFDPRYLAPGGAGAELGVPTPVREVLVDGRRVEPGQVVETDGTAAQISYLLGPREGSDALVAVVDGLADGLASRSVRIDIVGEPESCLVPVGWLYGSRQRVATEACPTGSTVTTTTGPPPADGGFADRDRPAWVRVAYSSTPPSG